MARETPCDTFMNAKIPIQDIRKWAKENVEPLELFDPRTIAETCADWFDPEQVFSDKQLSEWAILHGWRKNA